MNYDEDYGATCSMCGKPMSYRYCGMCVSCEQIDNDVPDVPMAQPCVRCGWLTTDMMGENHMCEDCQEEYWAEIADEHSGGKDEHC